MMQQLLFMHFRVPDSPRDERAEDCTGKDPGNPRSYFMKASQLQTRAGYSVTLPRAGYSVTQPAR